MLNYRLRCGKQSRTCAQRCYYRSCWHCWFIIYTALPFLSLFPFFFLGLPFQIIFSVLFSVPSLSCVFCLSESTPNVVSARLASRLRGACSWDRSPLSIMHKVWRRMTPLILKDYFLMEQFVTQEVYTVYLCTLCIFSIPRLFASADVHVHACLCVCVWVLNASGRILGHLLVCLSFVFILCLDLFTLVRLHV